jgi:hypothetical protein
MRKLFLLGVQPSTWKIIDELHQNTKTCVKWKQQTSETFSSHQGVKQGGLLSAELYKIYIEELLFLYSFWGHFCLPCLYMGERSPTLISSGMEYCEIVLLIKSRSI